jgi:uncharacterized protein
VALVLDPPRQLITRRKFLRTGACVAAGSALYSGEIERHWIEISDSTVPIPGLHPAFDGLRAVQLSDIHLDEFTEPFFLRAAVDRINHLNPDLVLLTGDFVTRPNFSRNLPTAAVWQCAAILDQLHCTQRYACLGNHDVLVGRRKVTAALLDHRITVVENSSFPIERGGGRFWLAGLDDPLEGHPDPDAAIPAAIRNRPSEPVVLLCHGPDYADNLLARPVGQSIALMLSGHTHGGQIRLPFTGPIALPPFGRKYVKGWFHLGSLQLHVNRGLGTVGLPFRFDCPPEISLITLRSAPPRS